MSANPRLAQPPVDEQTDRARSVVLAGSTPVTSLEEVRQQRADESPLSATELDVLDHHEQLILQRLLMDSLLSKSQAREILAIARRIRSPLRDIVCTNGYVHPLDYARCLAAAEMMALGTQVVDDEVLDLDLKFVRKFDPALLMRSLFCPLRQQGDTVVVLAANPADSTIGPAVAAVVPGAGLSMLVGTETDVTRLIDLCFRARLVDNAVQELRRVRPEVSASTVFTEPQKVGGLLLGALVLLSVVWSPWWTAVALVTMVSTFYSIFITYKLLIALTGALPGGQLAVSEHDVASLTEDELPLYSILVPVYREPRVVPILIKALSQLDYPTEKLDVLLLMEEDDHETIAAAKAAHPPRYFRFIYIPASEPRTKPKACNYGLSFCRGEYVTIFDAEDIPDPDQLRKAVLAFRRGPETQVCVQAALNYFNRDENYLTRMFTLEYSYWFDYMLPGLDRLGLPIPLGGTSNHFRIDRLRQLGAWDPYNVTEDADLGIRAAAMGYTVGVIRSTTYEEANRAFGNWLRQRSRWIKGYLQTWLVHNRRPLALLRQVGLKAWLSYQLFIGGTCLIFLINPVMWLLGIWNLLPLGPLSLDETLGAWASAWLWFNFLVGNLAGIGLNVVAVFRRRLFGLALFAVTNPLYWWMHSIAAYMGAWQLFTNPFYWEKTDHALTGIVDVSAAVSHARKARAA